MKKGVYVDGHEREDVVRDRQDRFLPEIEQVLSECVGSRLERMGPSLLSTKMLPTS